MNNNKIDVKQLREKLISDYRIAITSREASRLGRIEVLTGKAKFGIFGDGKEIPQIAMSKIFKKGDYRSGYYRDQTFMLAIGAITLEQFFSQLYSNTNLELEPSSGGRQMNSHFATRLLDENMNWKNSLINNNIISDISPTAGQMPRLLGLAFASKYYRNYKNIDNRFSNNGNEIAFGTIGDASTSEGIFWETLNAVGVSQVPMILSIWDDGYGISVPTEFQSTKSNISDMFKGFLMDNERGFKLFTVSAGDYYSLTNSYIQAEKLARKHHIPSIVHVKDCTQPFGHSTSGSHERYKSKERLDWERNNDCILKFKQFILSINDVIKDFKVSSELLSEITEDCIKKVNIAKQNAWNSYICPIVDFKKETLSLVNNFININKIEDNIISEEIKILQNNTAPFKKDIYKFLRKVLRRTNYIEGNGKDKLLEWFKTKILHDKKCYSSLLYTEKSRNIKFVEPKYSDTSKYVDGRIILRDNFDKLLARNNKMVIFGEDVGILGDVNQGLEGLQKKYGDLRVFDTGIREATIIGQGIGLALRGIRPIAEIQYIDYILYCLNCISDDLATILYRTAGGQKAPLIIRTRGHRLEGIWHSGSPMGGILNLVRGVNVLVPRDCTRAAGFYNTLMLSDEPAIIVEALNSYRIKEMMPINLGDFTTPIGKVDITRIGKDVTVITYGATWKIVMEVAKELYTMGVDCEVIDIQSLLPFDIYKDISKSILKTNKMVIVDEDVPGGASAFILNKVIEDKEVFYNLDCPPVLITASENRPAYSSDGDYFCKPSYDDILEGIYSIMVESSLNYKEIY